MKQCGSSGVRTGEAQPKISLHSRDGTGQQKSGWGRHFQISGQNRPGPDGIIYLLTGNPVRTEKYQARNHGPNEVRSVRRD